jgi:hypothetical protein
MRGATYVSVREYAQLYTGATHHQNIPGQCADHRWDRSGCARAAIRAEKNLCTGKLLQTLPLSVQYCHKYPYLTFVGDSHYTVSSHAKIRNI